MLTWGLRASMAFIVLGMIVALARGEGIGEEVDRFDEIAGDLIRLQQEGFIDLGLILLLLTPAGTVVAVLVGAIRQREWMMIGVCLLLYVILAGSVVASL
ncbi:MAG: DUF1634 domain-containing protein [Chloroflexota bacterium]